MSEKLFNDASIANEAAPAETDRIPIFDPSTGKISYLTYSQITSLLPVEGTFIPTITGVANISTATAVSGSGKYIGGAEIVNVSCVLTITPTANNTFSEVNISLPIASNFTSIVDVTGTMTDQGLAAFNQGSLRADSVGNEARLTFYSTGTSEFQAYCIFQYIIK